MKRYVKKPIVIEAIQLNSYNVYNIAQIVSGGTPEKIHFQLGERGKKEGFVDIPTLEGTARLREGDYLIKGIKGEYYPCKGDIFNKTYYPLEGARLKEIDSYDYLDKLDKEDLILLRDLVAKVNFKYSEACVAIESAIAKKGKNESL